MIKFGPGITASTLRLLRGDDDLILKVSETDQITLKNWFVSAPSDRIGRLLFADGQTLLATQGQTLVSAMAAFEAPSSEQTFSPSYQETLHPVITSAWQS